MKAPEKQKLAKLATLSVLVVFFQLSVSAETFGTGNSEPLPNLTSIQVYDVTGLSESEKETGGELVTEGLNETFIVNQTESQRQYRFSFRIQNEGDTEWVINESDELYHEGLNSSWSIDKIWYNISQDYDGGNFSDGKTQWNTSKGGTLDSGSEMYAKYLVTIDLDESELHEQYFLVNDTSENAGSQDYHDLDINKLGYLDMAINEPPQDTTLTQNKTFPLNTTVKCLEGECGEVEVSARYNESDAADTLMPEDSGAPFHTNESNRKQCSQNLQKDEECNVEWDVNATGELESHHLLDANASSSFSEISGNDTEDRLVQINMAVLINLSWSQTDFGVLDPGAENRSASENDNFGYNVTVPEESNTVDNLWLKATDMESRQRPEEYSIGAGNLSYSLQDDVSESSSLSNSYQSIASDLGPGTILNTFYWIDIPFGIYKGEYNGSIIFKANSTR